ncbi:hypothetical protein ACFQI7_37060 [Paenibacillus allorhizosphaerae]|uniref:Uncharacterized protein n=1 Tax=Paenibacillus allorhizosphaerae TaxID=2849866 RepID=A0ABM8VUQ9_9BACL|nr:hypothetical protein [Paenibacillus allorhizosphaerae]CAG7659060.1 hypothetical protein PAECIP111802_07311 [Paenibacillus allorhizosphaerae]
MEHKIFRINGYLEAMAYFNLRPDHFYTFEFSEFDQNKLNEPSNLKYLDNWKSEIKRVLLNWFFEVCEENDMPDIPLKFQEPCVNRFIELIDDFLGVAILQCITRFMDQRFQMNMDTKNISL